MRIAVIANHRVPEAVRELPRVVQTLEKLGVAKDVASVLHSRTRKASCLNHALTYLG